MMMRTRSIALYAALLPSFTLALCAPATVFAEDTTEANAEPKRAPEAYALVIPENSKFITVNELDGVCDQLTGWRASPMPDSAFCGVERSAWEAESFTAVQKDRYTTKRDELLGRLEATCALRSADPKKQALWEAPRATLSELKSVITGECPVVIDRGDADPGLVRAVGGSAAENATRGGGTSFVQNAIWATTDVVVDRAIETVNLWSLTLTLSKMCKESGDAAALSLAALTPSTCDLVLTGLSSADLGGFGARLKSAATTDAITFPRHFVTELLYLKWYDGGAATTPGVTQDLLLSTALGASMMELIVHGQHPIDALGAWARGGEPIKDVQASWADQPMTTGLYFASFLVANLDAGDLQLTDDGLLELKNALTSKGTQSDLSVTMLYNSTESLLPSGWIKSFGEKIVPKKAGDKPEAFVSMDLLRLHRLAERLVEAGRSVQVAWMLTRSAESGVPIVEHYEGGATPTQAWRALATATAGLLEAVVDALDITQPGEHAPRLSEASKRVSPQLKESVRRPLTNLSQMLGAIGASDRAAATLKGIEISLNLVNDAAAALVKEIEALGNSAPDQMKDRVKVLKGVMQEAGDGANLVGGLYGAETPDEMEVVLSAYIAPPGSYIEKRLKPAPRYWSMNAYVGLGGGVEFMRGADTSDTVLSDPTGAGWPVVALGPEFGWRICDNCEHPTNIGFFVPVVDLGTLAQYRIESSETTSYPEVSLRGVFAPGLYGTVGVSKWASPFAIQAGASFAPALRELSVDGETESRSTVRLGANLVVDVPLRK